MNNRSKPINIFEYSDFRAYLRDLTLALKTEGRGFSYRSFARAAGFSSPNFLKLVIEGQRNLSVESIDKFASVFRLAKAEAEFFRNLVHLNQAKNSTEKGRYAEAVLRSRPYRDLHPLKPAEFAYYTLWFFVAVRELVDTEDFRPDPTWIAQRFEPPITVAEARRALDALRELGLITRAPDGRIIQRDSMIATADEVTLASVAKFHRSMIQKGSESIERFSPAQREVSAVTMSLSGDGLRRAKEVVRRARREILEIAGQDKKQKSVYQFNFQLFPLTRLPKEGSES